MRITLVRPGYGEMMSGYRLDDGRMEPLSLAILAALLPPDCEPVLVDERAEPVPFDTPTDLVGISIDTFTARRGYAIADSYRARGVPVVLGGMHATLLPDEAADHADAVVTGDAEPVWPSVVGDARAGHLQPRYHAPFGPPQSGVFPRRDLLKGKGYLPVSLVQFGRGCPFDCAYCAVASYFSRQHLCRPVEEVIAEIDRDHLKLVLFADDNLTIDRPAARRLMAALKERKIHWACQASVDIANDPKLLAEMAESGCVGQLIGFESIQAESLAWLRKPADSSGLRLYQQAAQRFQEYGLLTWASFMLGADHDTEESIRRTVQFAVDQKFALAFFHILMPYPGTDVYARLAREGRLRFDGRWWVHPDFRYNTAAFLPRRLTPERLGDLAVWANRAFYSWSSILSRFLEPRTHLRSLFGAGIFARFNYLVRRTST